MKRRTKHSTESEAGSQGVDGVGIYGEKKRRPPRKTIRGANSAPRKAAATKARGRGKPHAYNGIVESVGGSGAGGDWGGFADGVAVDDEFDAAIALAAFGGVVGGYGLGFPEAAGRH